MGRRPETMQGTSDPLEDDPGQGRGGSEVDVEDERGSPVGGPIASGSSLCVWGGVERCRRAPIHALIVRRRVRRRVEVTLSFSPLPIVKQGSNVLRT